MPEIPPQPNILVAPLNWGLGHATRCIPIIRALEENGFTPILASDGAALQMLSKEFPKLRALELPSYQIEYPKNGKNFKWKMLRNLPKMMGAIVNEKKVVKQWIRQYNLSGIISDNRLGVVSKKIPSVFITHQLNVLTGNMTWLTGKLHRMIIEKFSECWIPDVDDFINLSGKLGHLEDASGLHLNYIGPLSRFEPMALPVKYDLMVILSGPEPQRGMLEQQLENEVRQYNGKVVFIKGVMEAEQKKMETGNVTFYNFMTSAELEKTFNESKLVLCRSGYTTIMDLAKLGKKAFFIPTPGQYEQEYLAKKLKNDGFAPYSKQEDFRLEQLAEAELYKGLPQIPGKMDWKDLFCLFERD
jgi:uncharacterized protein (TIGR00661 family)